MLRDGGERGRGNLGVNEMCRWARFGAGTETERASGKVWGLKFACKLIVNHNYNNKK